MPLAIIIALIGAGVLAGGEGINLAGEGVQKASDTVQHLVTGAVVAGTLYVIAKGKLA